VCVCRWLWVSELLDLALCNVLVGRVGKTSSHCCVCRAECENWNPHLWFENHIEEMVCREVLLGLPLRVWDKALIIQPFSCIWRAGSVFTRNLNGFGILGEPIWVLWVIDPTSWYWLAINSVSATQSGLFCVFFLSEYFIIWKSLFKEYYFSSNY
jgi:hypothetical protein